MKRTITLLRISYWWGIIADAFMAGLMLFPTQFASFTDIRFDLSPDFDYGLRYGAALMLGWTVLLFWADRKPLERKDILLITLVPVVLGLVIFEFYSIAISYTTLADTLPILFFQTAMSTMFIISYLSAHREQAP
jgi:hypothetical protein